ncbi:MAG: glucoamylase family protein [Candidatus Omnitrophota bacterium]
MRRWALILISSLVIVMPLSGFSIEAESDDAFLDMVEKRAFNYFWYEYNPNNGLVRNTTEYNSPASPTSVGFALAAIPIGIERHWIKKEDGYDRALVMLKSFRDTIPNVKGFYYHFISFENGQRVWQSELSSIDSAILFYGAIIAGEYFKGTEVEKIARETVDRADWDWFRGKDNVLKWEWTPESGFKHRASCFSEAIMAYILAIGSPTHPIDPDSWDYFRRGIAKIDGGEMVYCGGGSLFLYTLPCTFVDFRNKHDKYMDYWTNAKKAVLANRAYCISRKSKYKSYGEDSWGLSASMGPNGYKNYGAQPGDGINDGTIAPYIVVSALPLEPELAMRALKNFYSNYKTRLWGKYGFTDAFNIDKDWWCSFCIGIDKGMELLMIENYRTGLIWKLTSQSDYIKSAFKLISFKDGAQVAINTPNPLSGNPRASIVIPKLKTEAVIDGNPAECRGLKPIVLTTRKNENVEVGLGFFDDENDGSAKFYIGYTDSYLYIFGKITDNDIVAKAKGMEIYKNDGVEIFFDTDKNSFYFDGNPSDFQWGISPTKASAEGSVWAWGPVKAQPKETEYIVRRDATGYIIEVKIPFKEMPRFNPKPGTETLFTITVHDIDSDGTEGKLNWSVYNDPRTGRIYFGKAQFGR